MRQQLQRIIALRQRMLARHRRAAGKHDPQKAPKEAPPQSPAQVLIGLFPNNLLLRPRLAVDFDEVDHALRVGILHEKHCLAHFLN